MRKLEDAIKEVESTLEKFEEADSNKPLAKNEVQATAFSDGAFSLEFGEAIPAALRKSAVSWLVGKGFSLTEDRGGSMSFKKKTKKDEKDEESKFHRIAKRWSIS